VLGEVVEQEQVRVQEHYHLHRHYRHLGEQEMLVAETEQGVALVWALAWVLALALVLGWGFPQRSIGANEMLCLILLS
jgi:hypothetical protein